MINLWPCSVWEQTPHTHSLFSPQCTFIFSFLFYMWVFPCICHVSTRTWIAYKRALQSNLGFIISPKSRAIRLAPRSQFPSFHNCALVRLTVGSRRLPVHVFVSLTLMKVLHVCFVEKEPSGCSLPHPDWKAGLENKISLYCLFWSHQFLLTRSLVMRARHLGSMILLMENMCC